MSDVAVLGQYLRRELRREALTARRKLAARMRPQEPKSPPILLVGCPRSGTTLLYTLLAEHREIAAIDQEGHVLWAAYNHPRRHGWSSDALGADDVTEVERRYVRSTLARFPGGARPLDKTPKNVLRVPYLRALLPEATIVFVIRDGRATAASLLEGWRRRRGVSYYLPERLRLRDYEGRAWSYVLPAGWRDLQGSELAAVVTSQYLASSRAARAALTSSDVVVRYEDLVRDPEGVSEDLLHQLNLSPSSEIGEAARALPTRVRGAITPPRPEKWRSSADDLAPYLSQIEEEMHQWGYHA